MNAEQNEFFISVDIEASGPVPGMYSMLSTGACAVDDDDLAFECILKPTTRQFDPKALEVTGFDLEQLERDGLEPSVAMSDFSGWVSASALGKTPVFVGLNAAFDWAFVNYYFHLHAVENPFGFAPVDIKALYFGKFGGNWRDATSKKMAASLLAETRGNHDALVDAKAQAELFRLIKLDDK